VFQTRLRWRSTGPVTRPVDSRQVRGADRPVISTSGERVWTVACDLCHGARWIAAEIFSRLHADFRTPHLGTLVLGIISAASAALLPLTLLGDLIRPRHGFQFCHGGTERDVAPLDAARFSTTFQGAVSEGFAWDVFG